MSIEDTATGFKLFTELYGALKPAVRFETWLLDNFNYLGVSTGEILRNYRNI